MISVALYGATVVLVIGPGHILHGVEGVGYLIVIHHVVGGVNVGAAR